MLVDCVGLQAVDVVDVEQGQVILAHLVLVIVGIFIWIVIVLDITEHTACVAALRRAAHIRALRRHVAFALATLRATHCLRALGACGLLAGSGLGLGKLGRHKDARVLICLLLDNVRL